MPLAVPEWVIVREIDAEIERQIEAENDLANYWTQELKRIDPHLSVVRANANADKLDMIPECWYIRRENPTTVDSYLPLVGDNGERLAPGSWILEKLNAEDLWNPRVHRDREETKRRLREAKRREKARRIEQRRDEMALAVRTAQRLKSETGFTKRTDLKGKPTENSV